MCLLALTVRGSQVLIALLWQTVARDRRATVLVSTLKAAENDDENDEDGEEEEKEKNYE